MAIPVQPIPDSPMDHEPDTVATPEGDNEFAPDQPLKPTPDGALENPRGATPLDPYKKDKN